MQNKKTHKNNKKRKRFLNTIDITYIKEYNERTKQS